MPCPRVIRALGTGALTGAGAGAACAALDFARSILGFGNRLAPADYLESAVWFATTFGLAGALLGAVLGLFLVRARRRTALVMIAGSACFFATMLVNVEWLPSFTGPLSLGVDLVVLGAAGILLLLLEKRLKHPERPAVWATTLAIVLAASGAVEALAPPAGGPLPASVAETADRHPSVLLIVVDSLRADHTALADYPRETTPNLAGFAKDATVYTHAQSTCPWTKPSAASILTGLPPGVHGAEDDPELLPAEALSVAEVLSAGGYATGMFSANHYVSEYFGLGQGFDTIIDPLTGRALGRASLPPASFLGHAAIALFSKRFRILEPELDEARGSLVTDFLWWLDDLEEGTPWFAYLHFMEPHYPYDPPERFLAQFTSRRGPVTYPPHLEWGYPPFEPGEAIGDPDRRHMVDAYDGEIRHWDERFWLLLEALREREQLDDLVIVVTADHGESFYDHQTWGHGVSLFEELIHVPLVIRVPGGRPGRHEGTVSLSGLPATILDLAGFETPPAMLRWAAPLYPAPEEDQVAHARLNRSGRFMLSETEGGRKWIYSRREDAEALLWFDLDADPGERMDLSPFRVASAREAEAKLLARLMEEQEASLAGERAAIGGQLEDALRGLGYVR